MKQFRGALLLTITALIWGTAFVAQSLGMDHLGRLRLTAYAISLPRWRFCRAAVYAAQSAEKNADG